MPDEIPEFVPDFCEHSARRKDHIKGRAIRLENDEEWQFPLPIVDFRLSPDSATAPKRTRPTTDSNRRFSESYWQRQEAFVERWIDPSTAETTSDLDRVQMVFPLALDLLRRNYSLTDDQAADLLTFKPGDERNAEMWIEIARLVMGLGPKLPAVG